MSTYDPFNHSFDTSTYAISPAAAEIEAELAALALGAPTGLNNEWLYYTGGLTVSQSQPEGWSFLGDRKVDDQQYLSLPSPPETRLLAQQATVISQSTVDSHFSCPGLPDPNRYMNAREVRNQAQNAPPRHKVPVSGTSSRTKWAKYPKVFKNHEAMPLASQHPLHEFPVLATGPWHTGDNQGPLRAIYNPANRATVDLVYHDPAKRHLGYGGDFTAGTYRPRVPGIHRSDSTDLFSTTTDSGSVSTDRFSVTTKLSVELSNMYMEDPSSVSKEDISHLSMEELWRVKLGT
ncbi:Fc.00g054480.m01.CDS01 [Cosmosporella sp. VM-42]